MATVITIGLQTDTRARKEIVDALSAAERQADATGRALLSMKGKAVEAATATAALVARKKELQQQLSVVTTNTERQAAAIGGASRAIVRFSGDILTQKEKVAQARAEMEKYTAEQRKTDVNAKLAAKNYRDEVAELGKLKKQLAEARQAKRDWSTASGTELKEIARLKSEINSLTASINSNQKAEKQHTLDIRATTNEATKQRGEVRNLGKELKDYDRQTRSASTGQTQLNAAMIAGGVAAGTILTDAIRRVWNLLKSVGVETTLYAARNIELAIAMENVARVNGMTAGEIYAHEKAIRRLNISTAETREVLTKFMQAELDVGKAAQLARAAQDLAVVAGADSAETFERLTQGITTLQIRVLRTAGVYVSLDAALDKAAKSSGRARDSFSEQEKQAILMEQVLNFAARATGTYEASMTSASKQMRSMERLWKDLKDAMGQAAQGGFLVLIKLLSQMLGIMAKHPGVVWLIIAAFTALAVKILYTIGAATAWGTAMGRATLIALGFASAQDNITRSTAAATAAMGAQAATSGAAGAGTLAFSAAPAAVAGAGVRAVPRVSAGAFQAATAGAGGAAATTAAAGVSAGALLSWALLAAAIGGIIYLIYKLVTAQKALDYARGEDVENAIRQIKTSQEDAAQLRQAAAARIKAGDAYKATAELRKTELLALGRVTENTAALVRSLDNEADRYYVLAAALEKYINKKKEELILAASQDADANRIKQAGRGTLEGNIAKARATYEREQTEAETPGFNLRRGVQRLWSYATTGGDLAESSAKAMRDYKIELETLDEEQKQMIERWADSAVVLGKNSEQFLALIPNLSKGSDEYDRLNTMLGDRLRLLAEEAKLNQGAIGFQKAYNKALEELRIGEFDVQNTQAGRTRQAEQLNERMKNGLAIGLQWNEVVAGNRDAANALQASVQRASIDQESFNNQIATFAYKYGYDFLNMLYEANGTGDKSIETFGESLARASQRIYDVQTRLRHATTEIYDLMEGGGEAGRLEWIESNLQVFRRELDEINNLRRELGQDEPSSQSQSREIRLREIADLKAQVDARDALRENIYLQRRAEQELAVAQARTAQSLVDHETVAAKLVADNIQKRREGERDLHADLIRMSVERREMIADESGENFRALARIHQAQVEQTNQEMRDLIELRARGNYNSGIAPYGNEAYNLGTLATPSLQVGEIQLPKRPTEIQIEHLKSIAENTSKTGAIVAAITGTQPGAAGVSAPAVLPNGASATGLQRGAGQGNNVLTVAFNSMKAAGVADADIQSALERLEKGTRTFNANTVYSSGNRSHKVADMVDYIVKSTLANNLDPIEALNQAMRESTFNPFVQGRFAKTGQLSGASGLFQFIGSTGREYGFRGIPANPRQFTLDDERYDPYINTDKRNQYMLDLMRRTGGDKKKAYDLYVGASVGGNQGSNYSGGILSGGDMLGKYTIAGDALTHMVNQSNPEPSFDIAAARAASAQALGNPYPFREMATMTWNRSASGTLPTVSDNRDQQEMTRNATYRERERILREMRTGLTDASTKSKQLSDDFKALNDAWFESSQSTYRQLDTLTSEQYRTWFDSEERRASVVANVDLDVLKSRNATTDRLIELGRREQLALDPAHRADVWREAEATRREQALTVTDDIIRLEHSLETAQLGMADRVKKARLDAMLEVKNRTEEAYASMQRSMVNMADSDTVHVERIQANVLKWAEAQKGKDDIISDAITGAFDATFSVVDKGLEKLTSRMGAFGSILKSVLGDLLRLSLSRVFMSMMGLNNGAQGGGVMPNGGIMNASGGGTNSLMNFVGGFAGNIGRGLMGASSSGGTAPAPATFNMGGGMSAATVFNQFTGQRGFGFGNTGMDLMTGGLTRGAGFNTQNAIPGFYNGYGTQTSIGSPATGGETSIKAGGMTIANKGFSSLFQSSGLKSLFGQNLGGGKFGGIFGTKATGGTFGFGNSGFAQMLPLLGASFGGQLGGQSRMGQILGTAGGALAGIGLMGVPAALATGGSLAGSLGFLAPLFSNPLTAIAGGALLVGAVLLGRQAARRRDETTRNQLTLDSKAQLNKLLDAVNRDKMSAADALSQAEQIRADYMTQAGQLKDKKTRNNALATVRELDYVINQIKDAGIRQDKRKELDAKLVPEFAGGVQYVKGMSVKDYMKAGNYRGLGGVVKGMLDYTRARQEFDATAGSIAPTRGSGFSAGEWFTSSGMSQKVPGRDYGYDSVPAALRPGELVMNNLHQSHLRAIAGNDIFRRLGIPAMESGGYVQPSTAPVYNTPTSRPAQSSTSIASDGETNFYFTFDEKFADEAVKRGGGRVIKIVGDDLAHDGILKSKVKKTVE